MGNDIKNKKIGGIGKTSKANEIKSTSEVSSVDNVENIDGVNSVSGVHRVSNVSGINSVGGIRANKTTRIITLEEREAIFNMINEEADSLFGKDSKRGKVASDAVKMAIDAAIVKD
ncbi:MAG: hypothetical protein ACOX3T_07745 [Bdellovibrionota bacterium]